MFYFVAELSLLALLLTPNPKSLNPKLYTVYVEEQSWLAVAVFTNHGMVQAVRYPGLKVPEHLFRVEGVRGWV